MNPLRPLRGLWFGLFNPGSDDEILADIYLGGSERFDRSPDSKEWAVGPAWWPDGRYAGLPVLAEIYRIAYRDGGLGNDAEYPLCLGHGAFAVRELLGRIEPALILGASDKIGWPWGLIGATSCFSASSGRQGWWPWLDRIGRRQSDAGFRREAA